MAIIKNLKIDGRMVAFDTSAAVPRIYRARFGRDFFMDLYALIEEVQKNQADNSSLSVEYLEMFENIAYTMAKCADPGAPDTPEDWLGDFNFFSIYNILPQIVKLWKMNSATTSRSKKKAAPATDP